MEVFGKDFFPIPPLLDRAHRLGLPQTSENGRARPFIMLFHHFSDKEKRAAALPGEQDFRDGLISLNLLRMRKLSTTSIGRTEHIGRPAEQGEVSWSYLTTKYHKHLSFR